MRNIKIKHEVEWCLPPFENWNYRRTKKEVYFMLTYHKYFLSGENMNELLIINEFNAI